jgi:hypothetical protein
VFAYEYVQVYFETISKFYSNTIDVDRIQFISQNQINEKQLRQIIYKYSTIKVLQEDESLVNKKTLKKSREHQGEILAKMKETKCWQCPLLSYHITQTDTHLHYKREMESIEKVLGGGIDEKQNDFNVRNQILLNYGIIDSELNITFKGKVCAKANDIILTEFFFSGLIG